MKKFFFVIFLLFSSSNAYALTSAADSFVAINTCVKKADAKGCQHYFTAGSQDLYDRFTSYGLMECLPKDARYFSEEEKDGGILLRAKITDYGKDRYMRLLFVEEKATWKLDIPKSLQISMGKNWQNQVNAIEQVYLMLKQNLGGKLNCEMIRGLAKAKK
jgi:hypothetical protein